MFDNDVPLSTYRNMSKIHTFDENSDLILGVKTFVNRKCDLVYLQRRFTCVLQNGFVMFFN